MLDKILHSLGADMLSPSISDSQQVAKEMMRQYENGLCYTRKADARRRQNHFDGDFKKHILAKLRKQYAPENYQRLQKMEDISNNIVRRILNRTSLVYQNAAVREIEQGNEAYQDFLQEFNLDSPMALALKLARLHGVVGVRVAVRGGKPDFDFLHAGNCEVATLPDNPYSPVALLYELGAYHLHKDYDSDEVSSREKKYYQYFDNNNAYVVDSDGHINHNEQDEELSTENTYGEIPVIWIRSELCTDATFWPKNPSSDLVDAAEQIAVLITYANNAIKTSCYKQIYSQSEKPETISDNQVLDPVTLLQLPGGGGVLDMQVNIQQIMDYINFRIQQICTTYDMAASDFNLSGSVESGYSKKMSSQALLASVEQQKVFMRQAEKDIYRMLAIVADAHGIARLNKDAKLNVDFADMDFSESPQDELAKDEKLVKNNLLSLVDLYKKHVDADAQDEADVLRIIENNKAINSKFQQRGISFQQVAGLPDQKVLEPAQPKV